MWWVDLAKISVTILKDILPIIRDVSLAIVPWLGLSAWRRQLVGTKRVNAAEKLLETVYELQRAIQVARSPNCYSSVKFSLSAVHTQRLSIPANTEAVERPQLEDLRNRLRAHLDRFMEVEKKRKDVRIAALKGRVRLSKQVREVMAPLNSLSAEFVDHHLLWCDQLSSGKDVSLEERTLFSYGSSDEFASELDQAIEAIEAFCEPWLR